MKKFLAVLLLAVCLTGCGAKPVPLAARDGEVWDPKWVTVGGVLGVDTPGGFELRENNDDLASNGLYFATWSIGEAVSGEDGDAYDAQIYLLLAGFSEQAEADRSVSDWVGMADSLYAVERKADITCNGQDFTAVTYSLDTEGNPYARGASAFGVYRSYSLSVEISCREDFDSDPLAVLTDFLEHCHYAA